MRRLNGLHGRTHCIELTGQFPLDFPHFPPHRGQTAGCLAGKRQQAAAVHGGCATM
jgi:hypothetical protein